MWIRTAPSASRFSKQNGRPWGQPSWGILLSNPEKDGLLKIFLPDGNGFLEPVGPNGGGFLGCGPSFVGGAALPGSTVGVDFNSWAPFVEVGPATGGWAPAQRTAQRSAEFNVKFQNTKLGQNVSVKTGAPSGPQQFSISPGCQGAESLTFSKLTQGEASRNRITSSLKP